MKSKLSTLGFALILGAMIVSGCGPTTAEPTIGLANPASVYCERQGYTLEMRTDADGGQYGVCIFPDGGECEEWAFYRGECSPGSPPTEEQPTETPTIAPTVQPTEPPAPIEGGLQPLDPAACGDLANGVAQTLGVEAATGEAPFQDRVGGEAGMGCQVTATGTGLDFEGYWLVYQELIVRTCAKQGIKRDQLTLHADRGSAMRSKTVAQLLIDLGVAKSHSRPYTPTDNPYPEAQFKTMKYRPDYPDHFDGIEDARRWAQEFYHWYNHQHHHTGLALMTPATVHYGQTETVHEQRQQVLAAAYAAHPERFVRGRPVPPKPPGEVWINQRNVSIRPSLWLAQRRAKRRPACRSCQGKSKGEHQRLLTRTCTRP